MDVSVRMMVWMLFAGAALQAVRAVSVTAPQVEALLVTVMLNGVDVENAPLRPVTRA